MAKNYPLVAYKGDTYTLNFTVKNNGVPWDFTGYSARMQVRSDVNTSTKLLDLTSGDEITLDSSGNVAIVVPASVMADVAAGSNVYDFQVWQTAAPETTTETLLYGRFVVEAEVTQ